MTEPAARIARALLSREPTRVLVLGDAMLDRYLEGALRAAPHLPSVQGAPVLDVVPHPPSEILTLGGAANAAASARALGAQVTLAAVVGDDEDGRRVRDACHAAGIDAGPLLVDPDRPTTLKTRISSRGHPLLRVDREERHALGAPSAARLTGEILARLPEVDVLLISDYDKGVVRGLALAPVLERARALGVRVLVDPKPLNALRFQGAHLLSPNLAEARAAAQAWGSPPDAPVAQVALAWRQALPGATVVVTLGEGGALVRGDGEAFAAPAPVTAVVDATGAGDTFIAALAVAAPFALRAAVPFANLAAAAVVARPRTSTVTLEELADGEDRLSAARPEGSRW